MIYDKMSCHKWTRLDSDDIIANINRILIEKVKNNKLLQVDIFKKAMILAKDSELKQFA